MSERGRAAVFGAHGQIGSEAVRALAAIGFDATAFGRQQCDVTNPQAVAAALTGFGERDVVLNAAAYNDVAGAEKQFADALLANGYAPYHTAVAADRCGATFVHFSTDYVFDGSKAAPYVESDTVHPLNAYGRTKLCGEVLASTAAPRHYLVRVSAVFGVGHNARRKNFVERVLASAHNGEPLQLMGDGAISPTYAADAADLVADILTAQAPFGTYHCANSGACSWFAFAEEIVRRCGLASTSVRLTARESDTRVRRPLSSALASEKLRTVGRSAKPWQDGLARYLEATGRIT